MIRRASIILSIIVSIFCLAPGPASADKLVVFKNGKAMKVKSITHDGKWLKCEFDDKNYLAVEATKVLNIEEVAVGSSAGELRPNQVVAGGVGGFSPGPGGIGAGGVPPETAPAPDESAQEQADIQAAIAEEQAARQAQAQQQGLGVNNGANNGLGRRGTRIGGQPVGQPNQNGLQPTQPGSIFQNRNLTQRGLAPRTNVNTGPIRTNNQNANQNLDN